MNDFKWTVPAYAHTSIPDVVELERSLRLLSQGKVRKESQKQYLLECQTKVNKINESIKAALDLLSREGTLQETKSKSLESENKPPRTVDDEEA